MAVTNYHTVNGRILGETTGGVRTDYLTDALGSVTATVNPSAQVINRYTYKPYGALLAKTGVGADPVNQWVGSLGYRQTSKKYSDVYVRARHYDTSNGRWTAKDPIGFEGGDFSLYRYVVNRVVLYPDPSGLACSDPGSTPCNQPLNAYGCNAHGGDKENNYNCNASNDNSSSFNNLQAQAEKRLLSCFSKDDAKALSTALACLARAESNFNPCCSTKDDNGQHNFGLFQIDKVNWDICGKFGNCGDKVCDQKDWTCQIDAAIRILVTTCDSHGGKTLCNALAYYFGGVYQKSRDGDQPFRTCMSAFPDVKKALNKTCDAAKIKPSPGCQRCNTKKAPWVLQGSCPF
jgi:RHS repeat-associated protein